MVEVRTLRPGSGQALDIYTSAALRDGRAACGIVIRDADGQTVRVLSRAIRAATREEAAYRALLHGVWRAKGLGVSRVRVHTDSAEVVAQLEGRAEVPPSLIGLYLQTRAMLNAYRWSGVNWIPRDQNAEAALAAVDALDRQPEPEGTDPELTEPLPLWVSAEEVTA